MRGNGAEAQVDAHQLLKVLSAAKKGDFSVRMSVRGEGVGRRVAETLNEIMELNQRTAREFARLADAVGREGRIGERAAVPQANGAWAEKVESVNALVEALAQPTTEMARVIGAVAKGDLSQRVALRVDGRELRGEFLRTAKLVNSMAEQLGSFASEVTRVAREVGSDGKLGGQAVVKGVGGIWKDLTDNVNSMASNLTTQVRNIAEVTTAVAKGDLSKKITVDVRGEILELKNTINTMVDQLSSFASEVTRVAREVGSEGKLGGQAVVKGVGGTWKDLTDNVNSMASNLTTQVRNIAEVTTAVAKGDLSKKIGVDVRGEILELKNTINTMVDQLSSFASEVTRVAREVGTEGKLGGQAVVKGVGGTWNDLTDNVNSMASNLTTQVRNIAEVTTAVAKGDLSKKIGVDARGEILELKNTINIMVDQLSSFASEVTRVAREVGTEGKLGGQAVVRGVGGTWKDLTDNVNSMATNLTTQVRGIAKVVTFVANGDLKRKLVLDVKGEIAELADTINGMIDTLAVFADQVTTVAREVGIEGKLGGQARVPGTAGIWRDLTDNVNQLAANLTTQVRAIAEVATAVTKGDLTRYITVGAQGEVAALKDNINEMIRNLKDTTRENAEQDWLKTNLAKFTNMLQGERDLHTVSKVILSELAPLVDAQYGGFYVSERSGDQELLRLRAGYAYRSSSSLPTSFHLGEGLVGQCALDKVPIVVTDVPRDYVRIASGLGEAPAHNIVVLPVLFEGGIKAVIELASFRRFSEVHLDFLKQLTESIGIVLNTIAANMRTESLLKQSQALTEELTEFNKRLEQQKTEVEHKNREVEQAKRALEEKAEQLALTSKYKSEFLANMSHELRTPLNSLLLLSQSLSENADGNLSGRQVDFARTIHASGSDLLDLINDILDLAKIESGTVAVDVVRVRFAELHNFVERGFRPVAEKKGLAFRVEMAPDLPRSIETDGKRLQQVLRNLLSNAFKFTERGEVLLRVMPATQGWSPGHAVLGAARTVVAFSVHDTGIGIPPEKHQLIFEAFQQADGTTSRKYGGTGLGLSICRELAQLLGGEIKVESQVGVGSTFVLYLSLDPMAMVHAPERAFGRLRPRRTVELQAPVEVLPSSQNGELPLEVGATGLLVVSDRPETVAVMRTASAELGFETYVAPGTEAVMETLKQVSPEVVVIDLTLPGPEGWVLLDRLKHDAARRHVPTCVIGTADQRERALSMGAMALLEIEPSPEEASAVIRELRDFSQRAVHSLLIVDADEQHRCRLASLLGGEGVSLAAVAAIDETVAALARQRFDCVVLHWGEGDFGGLELLKKLEREQGSGSAPVLIYAEHDGDLSDRVELKALKDKWLVKRCRTPERLLVETSLFLHRSLNSFQEPERQMIRRALERDPLLLGRKVLVVDDDVRNIFALTALLERQGMKVLYAERARDGIEMLRRTEGIDVVLMDVMMPEMDGYQALKAIRAMPEYVSLPIVALTAKAMKGDREKCLAAGASDYIAKPVDIERLLSLLRVWLTAPFPQEPRVQLERALTGVNGQLYEQRP